jgi:septum formation protein
VISKELPLVLGSASPRRRELLAGLGLPIRVVAGDANEDVLPGELPERYLERVVLEKLSSVARLAAPPFSAILVADTVVVLGHEILGKPADRREAAELVGRIAGRTHIVHTRYAIARAAAPAQPIAARTVTSEVGMRAASDEEIRRYANTGEGLDKAGGYAAQGIGAFLVQRIEGSYSNVIGLPVCELVLDLKSTGLLPAFP